MGVIAFARNPNAFRACEAEDLLALKTVEDLAIVVAGLVGIVEVLSH